MAYVQKYVILTLLLLSIFCINQTVKCDDDNDDDDHLDEEDILLAGINSYRATLNLTALIENE
ncbi:hypothetical protein HanRHA438_Chr04g0158721 [Helianthus annuus]|nr:hypothetical protein HanRHA438_Chr04g0158721 [Helianthus annuus]